MTIDGRPQPLRIYWYAPFDNASEMELAQHLGRSGDDLTVETVSSRFGRPLPMPDVEFSLIRDLPAPANELYDRPTRLRRAQVALERAARRQQQLCRGRYDVVHLHTFNMFTDMLAFPLIARRCRAFVLSVHNVLPHERRGPAWVERLLHLPYRLPDHVVVAHESLKHRLVTEFGLAADRVSVIPLPSPEVTRTEYNKSDPIEFLFFGTLRENKGIRGYLDAIDLVDSELPIRFAFAGRGDAALERLLLERARTDQRLQVEIGWIDERRQAELYSRAWAVVVPYTSEFAAQSGTVRVAYSFGTPVIASDVGALGEQVRSDGTGWLVPERDPEELARCISRAVSAVTQRDALASAALELGKERSAEALSAQFHSLYHTLLGSRVCDSGY